MTIPMIEQQLRAHSSLIYPANDRIYYIADQLYDGTTHIHGMQHLSGAWVTVSPSYAAQFAYGQSVATLQDEAAGALTYDANTLRLYYRTTLGMLCYYEVRSITDYYFVFCPVSFNLIDQHLQIVGNLAIHYDSGISRIYYVGRWQGDGSRHIHCMIDNGGGRWKTVSPSYAADYRGQPISTQVQASIDGVIAVSPDGNTIAYTGNSAVYYYTNIDNVNYTYYEFVGTLPAGFHPHFNSLQFLTDTDLFYVSVATSLIFTSSTLRAFVNHIVYGEDYCNNDIYLRYPGH